MPVNVQLTDANFSLGPTAGFYYSVSKSLNALRQVQSNGTVVNTFPVALSQLRNPITELHYDGTFFWTLEDLPSNLGIVIKKWRLSPFKTFAFPNLIPIEFRWQDELTLIHGPNIRWSSQAFGVEHYHRVLDGSFLRGVSTIRLNSVQRLAVGDVIHLGPSTFSGFVGNEESRTVVSVNPSTRFVSLSSSLENSYTSANPVDYHKSILLLNDHSFSGTEDDLGSLIQFSWPQKQIIKVSSGGKYSHARAADFDQTNFVWVRGPQILNLDISNPILDLVYSLEANLIESDFATQINVFDMIADLSGNFVSKLQDRETVEDISLGNYTTTVFSPPPTYNFQNQTTLPVVNSVAVEFDTRHIIPLPSTNKINVTAYVRDQFNLPVLGQSVQFTAALSAGSPAGSPGTFSPSIFVTNSSGVALTQYTPSATPTNVFVDITSRALGPVQSQVSQRVVARVEQRGSLTTNPDAISPTPSKPIQQVANPRSFSSANIVQQLGPFTTAFAGAVPLSKPIEQLTAPIANDAGSPNEAIIEQRIAGTAKSSVRPSEPYDSPILQIAFNNATNLAHNANASKMVEQRRLSRNTVNNPIEQKPVATNAINIEQFNFLELVFPPCASIKIPVDTNILWRIRDFGFPFNISSLIFKVRGIEVQNSSDFTVTGIANGLQLDYNPPDNFDFEELITVSVYIEDTAVPPHIFRAGCSFTTAPDTRPPIVSNFLLCDQAEVSPTAPIEFDILDNGEGVDLSTLVLSIEGLPVCSGISTTLLSTVSGTGYHVVWEHEDTPFRYGSTVTVVIEAADLAPIPNSGIFICCFGVGDSAAPDFINFSPEPCETFVDTTTGLTFEVYGNVDGVDISTLEVRVDNALRKVIVRPRVLRSQ